MEPTKINLVNKWKPIINNKIEPFKLDDDILFIISEYIEKTLYDFSIDTPKHIDNILSKYKQELINNGNIKIINTYYNITLNSVVYELENGDMIYDNSKPLVTKEYIKKSILQFYQIVEPNHPLLRIEKIKKLRTQLQKNNIKYE